MSNVKVDSKKTNVILNNLDPSRRAQTLIEDIFATFNQFILNASLHLCNIKDAFRIKCKKKRPVLVKFTSAFCRDFVVK